jgi:hypothetical protein
MCTSSGRDLAVPPGRPARGVLGRHWLDGIHHRRQLRPLGDLSGNGFGLRRGMPINVQNLEIGIAAA